MDTDDCENIWIKIKDSNVVIGTIYRHPKNDLRKFIIELKENNNTVYLFGDLNINLASTDDTNSLSNSATAYVDMLSSNGYFPIISLPTRVNDHSASIIDYIVTNDHLHSVSPGIIKCDLTDNYPIFCIVTNLSVKKTIQSIYQRNFSKFDQNDFCEHLHNKFCSLFQDKNEINAENFNVIFGRFLCIINRTINIFAPLEKLSRSQRRLKMKPWITRGIFKSIKTKQKLYLTHFIHGNSNEKQIFKRYANQLNRIKVASKKMFYQNAFERSKCNSQLMWSTIKSLLSSSSSSSLPQTLELDGSVTTDPVLMAEGFNNYYSEVGALLADKIESCKENTFKSYISKRISSTLFLNLTNPAKVFNVISSPKTSTSGGYDNISSFFLKSAKKFLYFHSLTYSIARLN